MGTLFRRVTLDTIGGVMEIEYVPENINSRQDLYEQKN